MKLKTIILLATAIFTISTLKAQETTQEFVVVDHSNDDFKSLLGNKGSQGGYISIDITGGEIDGNQVFESGGRLAWIINHSFAFGVAGYGFAHNIVSDTHSEVPQLDLAGGYGGLLLEPIIFSKEMVHFSIPVVFGVGGAGSNYVESGYDYQTDTYRTEGDFGETDAFFIIRPGIELEVNLSRFFRVSLGGYYHHALGFELEDVSKNALNGFTGGVSFKFGWF